MARKSIKILNGRASALPPTEKFPRWRVIWTDPVTGKRRQTSGGDSLDSAKAKAAEILGDYVPDSESGVRPPTFDECFHSWMDAKKPQIAEQTAANYVYVYQRFIKPEIGEQSITAIGQRSIRAIQVSGVEFPILVKRIIKGVFEQAENWTHRPADHYADCIVIRSSRNEKRRDYVARGDIPSSKLVASFIITAYGTPARIALSAMEVLRGQGVKVGLFRPITLWPFPEKPLHELAGQDHVTHILDIELSSTGQMLDDIRLAVEGQKPISYLGHAGGVMPTVEEMVEAACSALKKEVK